MGHIKSLVGGSLSKHLITKTTPIEELINKTAKESDNVASNLLSYYIANKFDDDFFSSDDCCYR